MNATILVTIDGEQVQCSLNCTHGEEKILAPITSEIRRVVEEGLKLVGVEELLVSVE